MSHRHHTELSAKFRAQRDTPRFLADDVHKQLGAGETGWRARHKLDPDRPLPPSPSSGPPDPRDAMNMVVKN